MPNQEDQIKKSEPWSIKTRNRSVESKTFQEANKGTNMSGTRNKGTASKTATKEGAIVDVITRNKSSQNDRPFGGEKVNLSQKAGKGNNRGDGGKTMDTFSVTSQAKIKRNPTISRKEMSQDEGLVSKGKSSQKTYPKRGANASGANSG